VQKGPKYGFDALVLKGIRVGEQIKEFQVNISLFPSSLNRNTVCLKKNVIFKISYNYGRNQCRNRNRMKENKKSELELEPCQNGTVPQHW
jgi:hypothetical protein